MYSPDSVPPPLTLRPLELSAAPAIQAVYEASDDYFLLVSGYPAAPEQAEHDLAESARDDGRFLLGIHLEHEMVGVIDLRLAQPGPFDVQLGLILLAPASRRQKLGSWALRILEEWLRQATPTEAIVLKVAAQDYPAQRFFQRHGYTFTGDSVRVRTGETRSRLLFMRKAIQPKTMG